MRQKSTRERAPWQVEAALLFTVFVWGINFPVVKAALAAMHPHVLNAFRFAVSATVLGSIYVVRQRRAAQSLLTPLRLYGPKIVALGLLGYVFYQLSFIVGIDNTTAGSAALIMASGPLWTAAIGHVFRFERLLRTAWLGLLLSLGGTVLVVFSGAQQIDFGSKAFFGNLMMLAAAALWGAYTAFSRPVLRQLSPAGLSFLGLVVALPFLWGIAIPHADAITWERVTFWVWVAILFSGGLSTGLAVVIWAIAVQQVGASQTAVYGNLVPFVAVLSSVLLLGETLQAGQIAGGLLIIGGLVVMRRTRHQLPV